RILSWGAAMRASLRPCGEAVESFGLQRYQRYQPPQHRRASEIPAQHDGLGGGRRQRIRREIELAGNIGDAATLADIAELVMMKATIALGAAKVEPARPGAAQAVDDRPAQGVARPQGKRL